MQKLTLINIVYKKKYIKILLQHIQKAGRRKEEHFTLEYTKKEHKMAVQASPALPVLPVVMTMVIKLQ